MKGRCKTVNDKSMIALFEQRNEQGIAEANRAYGGLLHTIAMHILHDSRDADPAAEADSFSGISC